MNKKLLFLFIIFQFISCNNRNDETETYDEKFQLSISAVDNNSISINYKINNISNEKYLIGSQSENFDIQNFEIKIPILNNEGNLKVNNLLPNKKYFFKGSYGATYSSTISAITKEVTFSPLINKNIGLNPDNGNIIALMYSEINQEKTNVFILSRQIQQSPVLVKKIELHKLDLNGNIIWTKLIQPFNSPSVSVTHNGHKIQFLSDNNIAIITGKWNQKATIITKINPSNGDIIWQKEYPLLDLNGYQGNTIFGYSYQNSTMKIITNHGAYNNAEEIFINNDGAILSQRTIMENVNNVAMINAQYLNDGSLVSISAQNQYPQNGTVSYEGCIRKFDISNSTSNLIWSKFYGEYLGDDSFENYKIKDNCFYIDGYYGGNSGYSPKQHWILKTDFNGNIIWQNKLPVKQHFIYSGLDFFVDNQNNSYSLMNEMYAPTYPQYNIITFTKFDPEGNFIWEWNDGQGYNTDTFIANRAFELYNGEFIITGDRASNQAGVGDIRILKFKVN